ncbi:MAG: NUDIX hydrolase [Deltaproteobacteria bacterium]
MELTTALPDFPPGPDWTGAIIIRDRTILLMRNLAHQGIYYVLPGGPVGTGETVEAACIRSALDSMRQAALELARQLGVNPGEDEPALSIVRKVASHPWSGTTFHYFLVAGDDGTLLSDRWIHPKFDPAEHKLGVWMPYDWAPAERLPSLNVHPPEAVDICRRILDAG